MLNEKPIFIVSFTRGGSNILLNLLRSHPQVCSPRGETHQVFKGKPDEPFFVRLEKRLKYLPLLLMEGNDIFAADRWETRPPLKGASVNLIDSILFDEKLKARAPEQNLYKYQDEKYTEDEIISSRLLCKNLNGLIFLSKQLKMIYKDAVFFALVRNGYAVCEGFLRRSHNRNNLPRIATNYNKACEQIIKDSQEIPDFYIYKYEDIINNPIDNLKSVFFKAGLEWSALKKIRLETKQVVQADGSHTYVNNGRQKEVVWYDLDKFHQHFKLDANENQIKQLSKPEMNLIRNECGAVLEYFGY